MMALNLRTGILRRRKERTQRSHVITETEPGVMLPQAKESEGPQKLEEVRKDSLPESSERDDVLPIP